MNGVVERICKDLYNYAERKHSNGEVELANGILKAKCYIEDEKERYVELAKEDEKNTELRILNNYISHMTKAYRERSQNYIVVGDILLKGTSTAGQTSCIKKCRELRIDPYGYSLERKSE